MDKQVLISVGPLSRNSQWHLLAADALARLKRLLGDDVRFRARDAEFAQVFKLEYDGESQNIAGLQFLSQLIFRLQQSGNVYLKTARCHVCKECGHPSTSQSCSFCGGELELMERDCYFLRIRRQAGAIETMLRSDFVLPVHSRNDLLNLWNSYSGDDVLMALAVSRGEKEYLPTEWLQELAEILAACKYFGDEKAFPRLWPEAYIFIAREYAHYIFYWWGVISSLHLPRPGGLICHAGMEFLDRKGNAVSPLLLAKNYGYQGLRYFMLGAKTGAGENIFEEEKVIQKINLDLANELGNLVSRVIAMVFRFGQGLVPAPDILTRQTEDLDLRESALALPGKVRANIENQELHLAVAALKNFIGKTNRFIEVTGPWQLADYPEEQARLNTVLYSLCEALRFLAVALQPLLPEASGSIFQQLGIAGNGEVTSWQSLARWGIMPVGSRVTEQTVLFPRIVPYGGTGPEHELIMREELARFKIVAARIVSAELLPEYEGYYQMILYDGRQRFRVLAPAAHSYTPEYLSGKKVALIANLHPKKIMDYTSEGEVLTVETETGALDLLFLPDDCPEGSKILCLN